MPKPERDTYFFSPKFAQTLKEAGLWNDDTMRIDRPIPLTIEQSSAMTLTRENREAYVKECIGQFACFGTLMEFVSKDGSRRIVPPEESHKYYGGKMVDPMKDGSDG